MLAAHSSRLIANCGWFQYTGEIIRTAELDGNEGEGGRAGSQFVFDLGDGFAVDAQRMSNRIRRVNHASTSPNVRAQVVNHRGVRCDTAFP